MLLVTKKGLGEITWESQPDYDGWGWDTYWGCEEWMAWHKELKRKYGSEKANYLWKSAWDKQGSFDAPLNSCRYNTTFVNYFLNEGIDIRSFISALFTNSTETLVNATDATKEATSSISSIGKQLKWILPVVATGAVIVGGLMWYNKAKKVSKLIA